MKKFDCLLNEMLYIKQLTPSLNVQTDSIRAKLFVEPPPLGKSVVTLESAFVNFIRICTLDNGNLVRRASFPLTSDRKTRAQRMQESFRYSVGKGEGGLERPITLPEPWDIRRVPFDQKFRMERYIPPRLTDLALFPPGNISRHYYSTRIVMKWLSQVQ